MVYLIIIGAVIAIILIVTDGFNTFNGSKTSNNRISKFDNKNFDDKKTQLSGGTGTILDFLFKSRH